MRLGRSTRRSIISGILLTLALQASGQTYRPGRVLRNSGLRLFAPFIPTSDTPVIVQTSAPGSVPFGFSTTDNTAWAAGDFWRVQRATGTDISNAIANLIAGTTNADVIQQIQENDITATATILFPKLLAAPTGPLAIRLLVGHENGLGGYNWTAASNILTDTMPATSTVTLQPTDSTHKSQYTTVTGTPPLTMAMNNDLGAPCNVTATAAASGKRHFEVTLNSHNTNYAWFSIGVTDFAEVVGPGLVFPRPGVGITGASINIGNYGVVNLYVNGAYVNDYALIGGAAPQMGDTIVVEFDDVAHTVSWYHVRGATVQFLVTATLTSLIPTNWTAIVGMYGNTGAPDACTLSFGASPFAMSLSSGYLYYG